MKYNIVVTVQGVPRSYGPFCLQRTLTVKREIENFIFPLIETDPCHYSLVVTETKPEFSVGDRYKITKEIELCNNGPSWNWPGDHRGETWRAQRGPQDEDTIDVTCFKRGLVWINRHKGNILAHGFSTNLPGVFLDAEAAFEQMAKIENFS